jgi:hypothetical protein
MSQNKFKQGDRVRAVSARYGWGEVSPGDIGFVHSYNPFTKEYKVDFVRQREWIAEERDLEFASSNFAELPTYVQNKKVVQFQNIYRGGRPKGVVCILVNEKGVPNVGISKCNWKAGDIFLRKEGRRLARERAEMANRHQSSAYFKNGGLMFGYNTKVEFV